MKLSRERRRLLAQSSRRRIFCWAPATEAGVERVAVIFNAAQRGIRFVGRLFVLFVTLSELSSAMKREITGCMAIFVYLLLGLFRLCC